jgi:nucleoside-diphosphate-sugar epimerase
MAVLITGGAGFIGSHMVLGLLDAGEDVLVLDNLSTGFRWAVKVAHQRHDRASAISMKLSSISTRSIEVGNSSGEGGVPWDRGALDCASVAAEVAWFQAGAFRTRIGR